MDFSGPIGRVNFILVLDDWFYIIWYMEIAFQKAEKDFTLVIFGASGDLAKLKIFPAIYQLKVEKRLPVKFKIIGYARTKFTQEQFKELFEKSVIRKYRDID